MPAGIQEKQRSKFARLLMLPKNDQEVSYTLRLITQNWVCLYFDEFKYSPDGQVNVSHSAIYLY